MAVVVHQVLDMEAVEDQVLGLVDPLAGVEDLVDQLLHMGHLPAGVDLEDKVDPVEGQVDNMVRQLVVVQVSRVDKRVVVDQMGSTGHQGVADREEVLGEHQVIFIYCIK